MKIIPRTKEQINKDKVSLYRNALKAGLNYVGNDIFADDSKYPSQYYRFGSPKSVADIKAAIENRNNGNKELYAVQLFDFESLIPDRILDCIVNQKMVKYLKNKVVRDMIDNNLSIEVPENVYDSKRDDNFEPSPDDISDELEMRYQADYGDFNWKF